MLPSPPPRRELPPESVHPLRVREEGRRPPHLPLRLLLRPPPPPGGHHPLRSRPCGGQEERLSCRDAGSGKGDQEGEEGESERHPPRPL